MLSVILAALLQPAPPAEIVYDPYLECTCPETPPKGVIEISGLPKDAQLALAPDGRSVLREQTTIFSVLRSSSPDIKGEVGVWHSTNPKDCGVSYDYGRRYTVRIVRRNDRLETDYCLAPNGKGAQ